MNPFILYLAIGVILYPFIRKTLDKATDIVIDREDKGEHFINRKNFKRYIMFPLFVVFWPVHMYSFIKNRINKYK